MSVQHFLLVHLTPHVPIRLARIRVFVIQVSLEMEPLAQVCVLSVCLFCYIVRINEKIFAYIIKDREILNRH